MNTAESLQVLAKAKSSIQDKSNVIFDTPTVMKIIDAIGVMVGRANTFADAAEKMAIALHLSDQTTPEATKAMNDALLDPVIKQLIEYNGRFKVKDLRPEIEDQIKVAAEASKRIEEHETKAAIAGVNHACRRFKCPKCGSTYFGSINVGTSKGKWYCHDQFDKGCRFSTSDESIVFPTSINGGKGE